MSPISKIPTIDSAKIEDSMAAFSDEPCFRVAKKQTRLIEKNISVVKESARYPAGIRLGIRKY